MANHDRYLHPSGLHSARSSGRLRWLSLSLPRFAVRHRGPHPQRSCAREHVHSALHVSEPYEDQDRLTERDMAGHSTYVPKSGFARWLDARLPILRFANDTMTTFPTPRNLNFWYSFGGILAFM